jgi:hypothetical protein
MWTRLRKQSAMLNLFVSFTLFLIGLLVWPISEPEILSTHSFAVWVFGLWVTQWLLFTFTYMVIIRWPDLESTLLALVDAQSILVLAAAWLLLEGDGYGILAISIVSVVLYFLLLLLNLGLNPWNKEKPELWRRLLWVGLSETLASLSMPLLGLALFIRYHFYGFPFLLLAVVYGGFQRATYASTLVSSRTVSEAFEGTTNIYLALAVGKVFLGALFYALFLFVLPQYPSIIPSLSPAAAQAIRGEIYKALAWFGGTIVVPILIGVAASLITEKVTEKKRAAIAQGGQAN